jgi:hypothetical protein
MRGAIPPHPNKHSWHGAQLKQSDNFTLPYFIFPLTHAESLHAALQALQLSVILDLSVNCFQARNSPLNCGQFLCGWPLVERVNKEDFQYY